MIQSCLHTIEAGSLIFLILDLIPNPTHSLSLFVGVGIYIRYFDIGEEILPPGKKSALENIHTKNNVRYYALQPFQIHFHIAQKIQQYCHLRPKIVNLVDRNMHPRILKGASPIF
jgi:hypothetical protein